MRFLTDTDDFAGKRVLLATNLDVPMEGEVVRDDFRIRRALPTIQYLSAHGAQTIVISHRGDGSLAGVSPHLSSVGARFIGPVLGAAAGRVRAELRDGDVVLAENVRWYPGEKANEDAFARALAACGDLYVNDDFAASHRPYASLVGVPRLLPSYAGTLMREEVFALSRAFDPPHPFLLILGGAKFETKLPLVRVMLPIADTVVIAGALMNEVFRAQGLPVGVSRVAEVPIAAADILADKKIFIPTDIVVTSSSGERICQPRDVRADETIVDIGPASLSTITDTVGKSAFVLWNGPTGVYEKGFIAPTHTLAHAIADAPAESIVGGGDTLAAIRDLNLAERFSFVSTGGGAMLQFLAERTLPGIAALR